MSVRKRFVTLITKVRTTKKRHTINEVEMISLFVQIYNDIFFSTFVYDGVEIFGANNFDLNIEEVLGTP